MSFGPQQAFGQDELLAGCRRLSRAEASIEGTLLLRIPAEPYMRYMKLQAAYGTCNAHSCMARGAASGVSSTALLYVVCTAFLGVSCNVMQPMVEAFAPRAQL